MLWCAQVFNLPIEEAAKQLGIGQTMLKHYCRKFNIPRWPYRKRQSVVQLIQSIQEYTQVCVCVFLCVVTPLHPNPPHPKMSAIPLCWFWVSRCTCFTLLVSLAGNSILQVWNQESCVQVCVSVCVLGARGPEAR